MVSRTSTVIQPPLLQYRETLTVVINSMALGGAEWIVRDWILRSKERHRIHLVLLRDREAEWPIPDGIQVTRLRGKDLYNRLSLIGSTLAASNNPTCVTHLLLKEEMVVLEAAGANVVSVFHNAQTGWFDQPEDLDTTKPVIAVSHACKADLVAAGWQGDISVIHHLPRSRRFAQGAREEWRQRWNVPVDAKVIGMIGSLKPQKDYPHALRVLRTLLNRGHDYYLVILGGMVGKKDRAEARYILRTIDQLGLRSRVSLPGAVPDAVQCAAAFDLVLNTSHYEGLSVATLEVLASGIPVVATKVGGQGEVLHAGLHLIDKTASELDWVEAITSVQAINGVTPVWSKFPSYRLWTLHHLVKPFTPTDRTLFLTANLNIGGAQRSLVNLATGLDKERIEIIVTGDSYVDDFTKELLLSGVTVSRSATTSDPFTSAETIVQHVAATGVGTIVFWNTDAKLKLLLGKVLGHTGVRFVDVSPGAYAFESLDNLTEFSQRICYSTEDFYDRLDELVLKFNGKAPATYRGAVSVIPNGIPEPEHTKADYRLGMTPRIAVCGRLAPSKFVLEIQAAMNIVRQRYPGAELHVYGGYRESDQGYVNEVVTRASEHDHFHGHDFAARDRYCSHDAFVVLGRHQGCPNAALEALSVGMPIVANDDGGTSEQVIDGVTGRLTRSVDSEEVAAALLSLLDDRDFARTLGQAGRQHVLGQFSMRDMIQHYSQLLWGASCVPQHEAAPVDRAV